MIILKLLLSKNIRNTKQMSFKGCHKSEAWVRLAALCAIRGN